MSLLHFDYVNKGVKMRLVLGQRVVLVSSSTPKDYPDLWAAPDELRKGCIAKIIDSGMASFGSVGGLCVYLLHPLNTKPSKNELNYAKALKIPGNGENLIFLSSSKLARSVNIEPSNTVDETLEGESTGIFCTTCKEVCPRPNAIWTCKRHHHFCCAKHLFPWDEARHKPDWQIVQKHIDLFLSSATGLGNMDEFTEVRGLMCYYSALREKDVSIKEAILENAMTQFGWCCQWCLSIYKLEEILDIGDLKPQLSFYATETVVRAPQQTSPLRPALYKSLCARGFSPLQISSVVQDMSAGELMDHDEDSIGVMIQSSPNPSARSDGADALASVLISDYMDRDIEVSGTIVSLAGTVAYVPRLDSGIIVSARQLESGIHRLLLLKEGWSYLDIITGIASELDIPLQSRSGLRFYHMSKDGWATELRNSSENYLPVAVAQKVETEGDEVVPLGVITPWLGPGGELDSYFDISSLKANDRIYVGALLDNVEPRSRLGRLAGKHRDNIGLQSKLIKLSGSYEGCRGIRGDGNCYYRAIIFGFLEQLVLTGRGERGVFVSLREKFERIVLDSAEEMELHNSLLERLETAAKGEAWTCVHELEEDVLRTENGFDLALIRACRGMVAAYLLTNQDVVLQGVGLTLAQTIIPLYPDCHDLNDYCKRYITTMGVDAEGVFVELGLLLSALQCSGNIVHVDSRDHIDILTYHTDPIELPSALNTVSRLFTSASKPIATIDLLFRPGHYDLLYPNALIPSYIDNDRRRAVEEIAAKKALSSNRSANMLSSILSCGVVAPREALVKWSNSGDDLNTIVQQYLQSEYAADCLKLTDCRELINASRQSSSSSSIFSFSR